MTKVKRYLNCPMTEEEFNRFYDAVLEAEVAPVNEFEKKNILKDVCHLKLWQKEDVKRCYLVQ